MEVEFEGDVWIWQGPAPYYFVTVPAEQSDDIKTVSKLVTYGWGVVPVMARIGNTEWKTSLFPKDGGYIVPIKVLVRRAEKIEEGTTVTMRLRVNL